jgi:hypothetical protein
MINLSKIVNQNNSSSESSLHLQLKEYYHQPGDKIEYHVDKFIIDIVRKNYLIEVQTKNFSAIKKKLETLIRDYKVLLVFPIIQDKWILKFDLNNKKIIKRTLSPKHCNYYAIFEELIRIPDLICEPNLMIEALIIQANEIWVNDDRGSWKRRGWSIKDRNLIRILDQKLFSSPEHFLALLPSDLETPFTNNDLSKSIIISQRLASMMTYCLRKMNLLKIVGKKNRSNVFDFS